MEGMNEWEEMTES